MTILLAFLSKVTAPTLKDESRPRKRFLAIFLAKFMIFRIIKFDRIRQSHYQPELCAKFQKNPMYLQNKKILLYKYNAGVYCT